MICTYCNTQNASGLAYCAKCGAPLELKEKTEKGAPFFFHGFMIWEEYHPASMINTYHIWQGTQYRGYFEITHDLMEAYLEKSIPGCDIDPLLYRLLRLALGETEVERVEKDTVNSHRYVFEIRRIDAPEVIAARERLPEIMAGA